MWEHLLQTDPTGSRSRRVVPLQQWESGAALSPAQWARQTLMQQHREEKKKMDVEESSEVPSSSLISLHSSATSNTSQSVESAAPVVAAQEEDFFQPSAESVRDFLAGQICVSVCSVVYTNMTTNTAVCCFFSWTRATSATWAASFGGARPVTRGCCSAAWSSPTRTTRATPSSPCSRRGPSPQARSC